ncbi:Hypothetical_protein [Hexamita inflata]|uniref:Hypothetical_protein n=1 Tax=Hexamita inflata TaxID=28002 RepID=A0AA86NTX5_9EUKA|nr:Hypothetical protein HINF_LOCUS13028 [Hexamita inflata]
MPETFYLVPNERDYELMDDIKNKTFKPQLRQITPVFSLNREIMCYKDIPCHVIGFKEENNLIQVMDIEIVVYFHGIEVRTTQTCISPKIHSHNVQYLQCRPYITLFEHGSENQAFQFFLGIIYQNTNQNLEQIVTEQDETYSSGYKFYIRNSHYYDIDYLDFYKLAGNYQSASKINFNIMLSFQHSLNDSQNILQSVIKYKDRIRNIGNLSMTELKSLYIRLSSFQSYPTNLTRLELIHFVRGSVSQAVALLRCVQCVPKHPIDDKLPTILLNELGFERTSMDLCGVKLSVLTKMPVINPFDYLQLNDERTSLIIQFMNHPSQIYQISHSQIAGVGMAFAILDGKGNKTPEINKVLQMDYRFLDAGIIAFVE